MSCRRPPSLPVSAKKRRKQRGQSRRRELNQENENQYQGFRRLRKSHSAEIAKPPEGGYWPVSGRGVNGKVPRQTRTCRCCTRPTVLSFADCRSLSRHRSKGRPIDRW